MPPMAVAGPAAVVPNQQLSQPSWFIGAPFTKLWIISTIILYIVFHSQNAGSYNSDNNHNALGLDALRMARPTYSISGTSETYRYWTSKITFGTTGELIMGGMLLTLFAKQFEREMGSRKFSVFLLVITITAIIFEWFYVTTAAAGMHTTGLHYQGPYAALGALMYLYHKYTPRLHPRFWGMLGFTFSEKSLYYIWFIQVVGYGGWNTILASSFGFFAAHVYMSTNLHQTIDLPDVVAKPLIAIGTRISDPPPRLLATGQGGRAGRGMAPAAAAIAGNDAVQRMLRAQQEAIRQNPHLAEMAGAAPPPQPSTTPAPPDPAAIEQLTSMGFDRQRVMEALQLSNNNVERAADRLLSSS